MATDSGPGPTSGRLCTPLRLPLGTVRGFVVGCQTTGSMGTGQKRKYPRPNESSAKGRTRRDSCIFAFGPWYIVREYIEPHGACSSHPPLRRAPASADRVFEGQNFRVEPTPGCHAVWSKYPRDVAAREP